MPRFFTTSPGLRALLLCLPVALLMLPVLAVAFSWLSFGQEARAMLEQMAATVLPDYAWTSLLLCVGVALGVGALGMASACAVAMFDFPGRRVFEWALLLPLAMPAYVLAYAYTDFLQYAGPLQTALRGAFGLQGRLLPEVRSLGGAVLIFSFALYPYVYLLARSALAERASHLMEAARLLGARLFRRIFLVALPLARPAIAAGVVLALMETLADFGVSSYFGIQTFTAGIYKAWLAMDNRIAAAQLASMLLAVVALLLWLEHRAQRRMRFAGSRGVHAAGLEGQRIPLEGRGALLAWTTCALPVAGGFVLPVLFLLGPLLRGWELLDGWKFARWGWNSLWLAGVTAVLATTLGFALAFAARTGWSKFARPAMQLTGMGYALPGAVIVVGLLMPLGWLQAGWPELGAGSWLGASAAGLVWAYLVRFSAVSLQAVQSGYTRMPMAMDDSARMLGATRPALLARVHAPLLRPSLATAALLVFVDVMKELPATLVLRPFNTDTLAVVAYQLARDERLGEAAWPALALVAVGLLPVALLSRAMARQKA
jgi:iron(III) transport system permease protein